jgi:hypothetical protein
MARGRSDDVQAIRLAIRDRKIRELAVKAVQEGVKYRMTKKGVMFYAQDGYSFTIHCTDSDHRAIKNAEARFRKIGIEMKGKHDG